MFANANYERVGAAQPLAGAYQALSDSRSATPSPPASQTNHHAYRQPSANPFGSPTPSIMSRRSSIDSYAHLAPNRPEDGEDSVYSGRGGKDAEWAQPYFGPEDDDDLHNPEKDSRGSIFTWRGLENLGCLILMLVVLVVLFAGYPIIEGVRSTSQSNNGGFNAGGINASGQIPKLSAFELIDPDTPEDAYHWTSMETGEQWDLVFSDEFNRDGRTFYPGDDPFWEAVDLHYWSTKNLEYYDPRNVYTKDGHLVIELNDRPSHGMDYTGGMLQSWNRFCFTGGYIEAKVSLPGTNDIAGLWPAIWTMGNLGRAGYGGSLDGMWPYTYDSCDVGTLKNQTKDGEPAGALASGPEDPETGKRGTLSYLPGQRLSRCTCENDKHHPGPKHKDGSWVGRGAPEIDMFEAAVDAEKKQGHVSVSSQWAPFDFEYEPPNNTSETITVYGSDVHLNSYKGAVYQQATSGLADTDPDAYTNTSGKFSRYGFEYAPGDDGHITWLANNEKAWRISQAAMGPNEEAQIGQRLVPVEPMYIIMNLGVSDGFQTVDRKGLATLLPTAMHVDYVRVYQDPKKKNIGCDPKDYPTADYINSNKVAYWNNNITTFEQLQKEMPDLSWPKNKQIDTC